MNVLRPEGSSVGNGQQAAQPKMLATIGNFIKILDVSPLVYVNAIHDHEGRPNERPEVGRVAEPSLAIARVRLRDACAIYLPIWLRVGK